MKNLLLLFIISHLFSNLKAQQVAKDSSKIDSTIQAIQAKTQELEVKNKLLLEANRQLDAATNEVKEINDKIQQLKDKSNKTEVENAALENEYKRKRMAIDKQKVKEINLVTAIKAKDSTANSLDSIILNKNAEILAKDANINAQNKTIDSLKTVKNNENDLIMERQALISKQLDSLEVVATMSMRSMAKIYNKGQLKDSARIREVNMTVKEGVILEIIVKTEKGTFRNKNNIIDLVHIGDEFVDENKDENRRGILHQENQKYDPQANLKYIFLDDVIDYNVIRSYNDVVYGDFDITLLPTKTDSVYLLRESTSLNTYFNVAVFTDIKGLSGDANGLAQFTADAKFITRTKSVRGTALVPFHYISFQGGLSKFDNDFKGTALYNNDSVSRKELLQRATYSLGLKVNLIRGFSSPKPNHLFSSIQLNAGYNFMGSKVYDTVQKGVQVIDTVLRNVSQNQIYIEPLVTIERHRNFAITLSLPVSFVSVKHSSFISNREWEPWIRPSINLMYFGKRQPNNKIFFRYNHHINLKHPTEAFTQMQLGISSNLTEVWDRNKK
ncbi:MULTISPECIES: coiled-coil domain-containing protein [Niastella]|uniref:Uncharacterized protein n=1 Tax=Niastella soli TaxID=2821487 RepID=A0ABS3YRM0_9BACT|nr:hypothetical protein [Niastella soli]MBO9200556.1 hypothetical protein [Niastella soli]